MIKKLRIKFTAAFMLALAIVLTVILGGINYMNYQRSVSEADAVLEVLAANGGAFPQKNMQGADNPFPGMTQPPTDDFFGKRGFTAETPYESRFFGVLIDQNGQVLRTDIERIAAVDSQAAGEYAIKALESGKQSGFIGDYRYTVSAQSDGSLVLFLDCGKSLSGVRSMALTSITVSLIGLAAVLVLLIIFSGRIIKPVSESYEKQKRFITDAGHEIKTPLTIIGADADLIEMDSGKSEWLDDIKRQTERLTALTNDLVYLSKMDESNPPLQLLDFPLSDVAEEAAQSFAGLCRAQKKTLSAQIMPMISYNGDEKAIRQLISVLLDNAVKYSPENGTVSLSLKKEARCVKLTVSNATLKPIDRRQLNMLFDRFYRADQSRSSATACYGLGLSIARSIVAAHRGKIHADSPSGNELIISVTLPL